MKLIIFLDAPYVIKLHDMAIEEFGGASGIRDVGLLESAINHPKMISVYDKDEDIFNLASAYFYHLIKNHPFVDGNKRTGLFAALTFLEINGHVVDIDFDSLYQMAIQTANSSLDKIEIARLFKQSVD